MAGPFVESQPDAEVIVEPIMPFTESVEAPIPEPVEPVMPFFLDPVEAGEEPAPEPPPEEPPPAAPEEQKL